MKKSGLITLIILVFCYDEAMGLNSVTVLPDTFFYKTAVWTATGSPDWSVNLERQETGTDSNVMSSTAGAELIIYFNAQGYSGAIDSVGLSFVLKRYSSSCQDTIFHVGWGIGAGEGTFTVYFLDTLNNCNYADYTTVSYNFTQCPVTGTEWTWCDLLELNGSYMKQMQSGVPSSNFRTYCTQQYLIVWGEIEVEEVNKGSGIIEGDKGIIGGDEK